MNDKRLAIREAYDYLYFIEGGGFNYTAEPFDTAPLLRAYHDFERFARLRRPCQPVEKMNPPQLAEELAFAALAVTYLDHSERLLEQLTPGRAEFEKLAYKSQTCAFFLEGYRRGNYTWPDTVMFALKDILRLIALTADELKVETPEFPMPPESMGLYDKVAYLRVACAVLADYQSEQIKQLERAPLDPMLFIPGLTAEEK